MTKIFPLAAIAALAVTLSACTPSTTNSDDASTHSSGKGATEVESEADAQNGKDSGSTNLDAALAALETAQKEISGGSVSELEFEDGDNKWEVTVLTDKQEVDLDISADGKKVVDKDKPSRPDQDDLKALRVAKTDLKDVLKSAVDHTPGDFDEVELEKEDGKYFWEIDIYPQGEHSSITLLADVTDGSISQQK
jgi:uncharacterized membrane protein YkoI